MFDAGQVEASLTLDRSPFTRTLAAARRDAARFAGKSYEATLGVKGSAKTAAELQAVDEAADSVDGRNVDIVVDEDGSASNRLGSLSDGFKNLATNIRATGTLLKTAAIPFAIAGIGAAVPTIAALGASFAGLALNLGKAAAGFGLVAAAAGGGALVGLKAYTSLISSTVSSTREAYEELRKDTAERVKAIRQQTLLTKEAIAFNEEIDQQVISLSHLQAAVGKEVFPKFTREMEAWRDITKELTPFIARTAGNIASVATGFTRWFRTARDGQLLRETVGFISESAERGARFLSELGQAGISAFVPLIPLASGLQKELLGIIENTNRWVQSARGQRRLGEIYRGLWRDAKKLWPVVRDLSISVGQFFTLLDRTGIADQASRGLRTLAGWLREATERGGGFEDFLRDVRGLMPFVGGAVMEVVGAIGGIADAAINARQKGHRLTILQEIFRGISRAAKPLERLVTGTFKDLGPQIAKLIPRVARFLNIFAGSSGPLVAFVDTINRALRIFNDLPGPVKRAVGNLVALKLILGGLGVGAVVGPIGRFASNMLLANLAARKLAGKSALLGVASSLGKIGLVLAGGIGLGILFYGLKRAYDKNEEFRDSVDKLREAAGKAFRRISNNVTEKVLPALRKLADRGANFILDIFDLDGGKKKKLEQNGRTAVRQFGYGAKQEAKQMKTGEGSVGYEIAFSITRGVLKGLGALLRSGLGILRKTNTAKNRQDAREGGIPLGSNIAKGARAGFFKDFHPIKWALQNLKDLRLTRERGGAIGESIRRGILNTLPGGFLLGRLADALRKVQAWADGGRGKTQAHATGTAFKKAILSGLPLGALLGRVQEMWDAVKKWAQNRDPGKPVGRSLALSVLGGLLGVDFSSPVGKKLAAAAKNAADKSRPDFLASGKNAASGFLEGFKSGGITGGVVGAVRNAYEGVRKWQQERSPAKRWMPSGRNAALGWLRGWREAGLGDLIARELRDGIVNLGEVSRKTWERLLRRGWVGRAGDDAERLYRPSGSGQDIERRRFEEALRKARERAAVAVRRAQTPEAKARALEKVAVLAARTGDTKAVDRLREQIAKLHYQMKRDHDVRRRDMARSRGGMHRGEIGNQIAAERWHERQARKHERGINKDEMREVMREHRHSGDSLDYDRLGRAIVAAMKQGLPGFIDHSMGSYFNHRNAAGADPR